MIFSSKLGVQRITSAKAAQKLVSPMTGRQKPSHGCTLQRVANCIVRYMPTKKDTTHANGKNTSSSSHADAVKAAYDNSKAGPVNF